MMTLKHAFNAKDMNSLVYKILKGKVWYLYLLMCYFCFIVHKRNVFIPRQILLKFILKVLCDTSFGREV